MPGGAQQTKSVGLAVTLKANGNEGGGGRPAEISTFWFRHRGGNVYKRKTRIKEL